MNSEQQVKTGLRFQDWMAVIFITAITVMVFFLVIVITVYAALGQGAVAGMLIWLGTMINYAVFVVPLFLGVYLLLKMTRQHDAQIIGQVAMAITAHDAVDAAGDAVRRSAPQLMASGFSGTDIARITEAQNQLHRAFLEQVGSTARTLNDSRSKQPSFEDWPQLPPIAGMDDTSASEEW